ncbi:Aryl hydrocarbon receptor nuclear translocator-like protein 2 Brain and muscle ARNT-like 2 [Channa argus]|uniref:Aryl hydrocarbon receptor nuclear translocator-like protein 2 Brain and muscle ARNT-like 2 n=1 Tax=Channa argus TaxID=215402 RepID=A0A6G1QR08_CHAAH|nr:Aryl hydrocarbon receptor nuclear translocator-like protein 2 Brain and muscle ARNT-like 2 [Channa argus]
MSAGCADGTADRTADPAAEEEGPIQAGSSVPGIELPRKRKGVVEGRSDARVQEPHRQIEKRRRDKMNNLIDELAAMIPACQPMARKLDKLTVLRKAVQHLKALRAGTGSAFTDTTHKPSILPHDDLRHLLLKAVVSCDRAKILFISESVSKILNSSQLELTGKSLFDFIHPKDINKVKEQLSSLELNPRQRLIDTSSGVQAQADTPTKPFHLSTGARRSFFCRMKHNGGEVAGKRADKLSLPGTVKKKADTYRYCTLHCTGYMRSWPGSQLDSEGEAEKETSNLTCLVTVCRLHPHVPHQPAKDIAIKPTEFVTRYAIDGKFTFVDQQATTVIGYLPQEVLGTSCYEYFHQNDLQHLAEKHRQDDTKQIPIIPSLSSGVGTMIYAGSIGTQIANELIDSYRVNSSPSSEASSPFGPNQDKCPLVSPQTSDLNASSREDGADSLSQSQSDSRTAASASTAAPETTGESSQLELDSMVVPGLSSFSSDEAAMAVIMSLLETDVNMSPSGDFEDLHWPF